MAKNVNTFWMERNWQHQKQVEDILVNGHVRLVEYENLETEYLKHTPMTMSATAPRKDKKPPR